MLFPIVGTKQLKSPPPHPFDTSIRHASCAVKISTHSSDIAEKTQRCAGPAVLECYWPMFPNLNNPGHDQEASAPTSVDNVMVNRESKGALAVGR
jgi:hypothetical protein